MANGGVRKTLLASNKDDSSSTTKTSLFRMAVSDFLEEAQSNVVGQIEERKIASRAFYIGGMAEHVFPL